MMASCKVIIAIVFALITNTLAEVTSPANCLKSGNKTETATKLAVSGINNEEDKWSFKFGNVAVTIAHVPTDVNDKGTWNLELKHFMSNVESTPGADIVDTHPNTNCTVRPDPDCSSSTRPSLTGPDYEFHTGYGYYYVYKYYTGNFELAKRSCKDDQAHVSIINSQGEADIITNMMKLADKKTAYVGIHKEGSTDYETIYGDSLLCTGFIEWDDGEPSDRGDCVVIKENGKYATSSCSDDLSYVCEAEYPC